MVRKRAYKLVLLIIVSIMFIGQTRAQYASEDELKKAADKYFIEQDYIKSLPLFSQLLSLYPKDANYNYKYGASFFFAKRDKEDALRYLKFACGNPNVDPKAYYFLGLVYHHNYNFSAAEVNYNKFKQKGNSKDLADLEVDRKIEMCKNGTRLLKSMTDIGVLYKKEIKATDFFRSYDLKGIGGKIIVKPDEFKTKLDVKRNENTLIHLGDQPKMVIFSSYGDDGKTGKDIYRVIKLPNGEWSKPAPFDEAVNTPFDEDYPFLHPDGRTLYFSSKGFNSMGGYDIFKSELNPQTGKWSYPENLDFPINTPDDDILFISDIDNELAFFASSRASMQGELTVYKVQVATQPAENSIIKGVFIAESNPSLKSAKISVMDAEKERTYGVFTSSKEDGGYVLVFPGNGGKFKILVETLDESPIHSAIIEIPRIDGFRALKQELRLVGQGDNEKLVVKNLFDESDEFDITDPLIVENLLKVKAKLDVNLTEEELNNQLNNQNTTASDYADFSDEQLVAQTTKQADEIIAKSKEAKKQSDYSYVLAQKKSNEAKQLFGESLKLEKEAEQETNVEIKQQKLNEAAKTKMKAAKLVDETIAALNLAKAIESQSVEIKTDVEKVEKIKKQVASNIASGNRPEAENNLAELEKISEASYLNQSSLNTEKKLAEEKLTEKEIEYNKSRNEVNELKNREIEINTSIADAEKQLAATNKKSDKENIATQINALKIDLEDVKYDLATAKKEEEVLSKEFNSLKNSTNTFSSIADNVAKNSNTQPQSNVDKLALDNDVVYFENQGLVGVYSGEETTNEFAENNTSTTVESNQVDLTALASEYSVINEEGKIIDYNTDFSTKLVEADNNDNEYQKNLALAKVNQDWSMAIGEEIEIKEKQLAASDDLNEKINLENKINQLKTLQEEKQKEANKNMTIAEVLASDNEVVESENITDASGNIIDYETQFNEEIASIENSNGSGDKKAAVYSKWNNAIDQEILLKNIELEQANDEEKLAIENRIAELNAQKLDKENKIEEYTNVEVLANETNINENTSENAIANNVTNNPSNNTNYQNILDENGEVVDYASNYQSEIENADNLVGEKSALTSKESITKSWINDIDSEIAYQEEQLALANNETEKEAIKSKINDLNAEKNERQEELVNYQLAMTNTETVDTEASNVIAEETSNTANVNDNNISNIVSNKDVLDYQPSEQDANLNLAYNNEFQYNGEQSKKEMANVNALKNEAVNLYSDAEQKNNEIVNIENVEERAEAIKEVNKIKEDAERKELEIARVYEKSNKSEFYNNQAVLSQLKSQNNRNNQNATVADLMEDEAYNYFEQAQNERNKAFAAASFTSKESALQKAYNLELQALDKQNKAIALYAGNKNIDDVYANVSTKPSTSTNNSSNVASNNNVSNNTIELNNNSETLAENNNITTETYSEESPIYQPASISLPSDQEKIKAQQLEKEAEELEAQAQVLSDSANVVSKKKEKDNLLVQVEDLKAKAAQKRKEAEVLYAKAEELKAEDAELADNLMENRTALSNEKINNEDKEVLASLSSDEVNNITTSSDFVAYSEAKKESRRLIKEAEISYIEADKYQQEVEDEKALGVSLNALAAGAEGDRKTKLLGQIEQLKAMIAENEQKANDERTRATEKEIKALSKTNEANDLIAGNSSADKIKTLEKINYYNPTAIEDAVANNQLADNTNNTSNNNSRLNENNNEEDNVVEENNLTEEIAETTNNVTEENVTENTANTNIENETNIENIVEENVTENNVVNEVESPINENTTNNNVVENEVAENTNNTEEEAVVENNTSTNNNETANEFENETELENEAETIAETNTTSNNTTSNNTTSNNNVINEETATLNEVVANSSKSNVDEVPEVLTSPIFVLTANKSNYSSNKPIPTVEKLPEGLVFKVQIGAFRNPIPQDHFRGFAPIMAEDAGNGITRYTAGLFKTFNMANEAKVAIRSIGYNDAFVVAFYNGKRISINEARAMLGEQIASTNTTNNSGANNTTSSNNTNTTNNSSSVPTLNTNYEEVNDGVSTDVHKIEGVFFTVQVGVYSKPVTADQLNNVKPLNSEKTSNGLIRYTSGVYKTLEDANVAKDNVRNLGITDAFVIAYANGNRVSVSEAVGYLNASGGTPANNTPSNNSPANNTSSNNTSTSNNGSNVTAPSSTTSNNTNAGGNVTTNPSETNTTNNTTTNPNTAANTANTPSNNTPTNTQPKQPIDQVKIGQELKLDFRVLLGEYADEVPVEEAAIYLKLSSQGLKVYEKNGNTVYEIGSYPDYPSALDMQLQMKEEGIKKPKVVAFKDGEPIEINEALELVKNNNQ